MPEIVHDETDADWLPKPNRVTWVLATKLPEDALKEDALITAAYVLASFEEMLLVARHRDRGWDIPGGHRNYLEAPEQTAIRETLEETGSTVEHLIMFAYQKIELLGIKPAGYTYPHPIGYQVLYLGKVSNVGVFQEEEDMVERAFWRWPEAVARLRWSHRYPNLFSAARAIFAKL